MNRILTVIIFCALLGLFTTSSTAQTKREIRVAYVLEHLSLDKATAAKFKPVLNAYLKEMKDAKDIYDDVKDKYKEQEKSGKLTDSQANQLLKAKLESDTKELAIRKKYQPKFVTILKGAKAYYAFDLANDKMSKITGEK